MHSCICCVVRGSLARNPSANCSTNDFHMGKPAFAETPAPVKIMGCGEFEKNDVSVSSILVDILISAPGKFYLTVNYVVWQSQRHSFLNFAAGLRVLFLSDSESTDSSRRSFDSWLSNQGGSSDGGVTCGIVGGTASTKATGLGLPSRCWPTGIVAARAGPAKRSYMPA